MHGVFDTKHYKIYQLYCACVFNNSLTHDVDNASRCVMCTPIITLSRLSVVRSKSGQQMERGIQVQVPEYQGTH